VFTTAALYPGLRFSAFYLLQADGTYKLHHGGWTLCDLGSHLCRWDAPSRKYVHTFFPMLYMFCRTECYDAYLALFETLRSVPTLFGIDEPLLVACGGLDRSSYIAEAYFTVWPDITPLLCWPHLARKFTSNEFWVKLENKDNRTQIEKQIRALHVCRSERQFRLLVQFTLDVWAGALGERAFAEYFEEYYVLDHWGNWYVTASKIPGVLPTAQGIESGHRVQKLVISRYVRARACARAHAPCALPPRTCPSPPCRAWAARRGWI
jgi:hypothetical protein